MLYENITYHFAKKILRKVYFSCVTGIYRSTASIYLSCVSTSALRSKGYKKNPFLLKSKIKGCPMLQPILTLWNQYNHYLTYLT